MAEAPSDDRASAPGADSSRSRQWSPRDHVASLPSRLALAGDVAVAVPVRPLASCFRSLIIGPLHLTARAQLLPSGPPAHVARVPRSVHLVQRSRLRAEVVTPDVLLRLQAQAVAPDVLLRLRAEAMTLKLFCVNAC